MNRNEKVVSVVMPNYNCERYISEAITSVLNQTHHRLQLIIVDDSSTDSSLEIIRGFQDERIKLICLNMNGQVSNATNVGLAQAEGDYIALMDSDDIWHLEKLERQLEYMEAHLDCGLCYTSVNIIDANGNIANSKYKRIYELFDKQFRNQKQLVEFMFRRGGCLLKSSVLIRKSAADSLGEHNLAFVQGHDYEYFLRAIIRHTVYILPEKLSYYRWEDDSKTKISLTGNIGETRFANERIMAVVNTINGMSDEEYVNNFKNEFRCPESYTEIEIECEKSFYLLSFDEYEIGIAYFGILKLEQLLKMIEGREILNRKFSFTQKDLYKINTKHFFNDYILRDIARSENERLKSAKVRYMNLEEQYAVLRQYVRKCEQTIKEQEQLIEDYRTSTSWKITRSLRALRALFNK